MEGGGGGREKGVGRERGQGGPNSLYFLRKINTFYAKACISLGTPIKPK